MCLAFSRVMLAYAFMSSSWLSGQCKSRDSALKFCSLTDCHQLRSSGKNTVVRDILFAFMLVLRCSATRAPMWPRRSQLRRLVIRQRDILPNQEPPVVFCRVHQLLLSRTVSADEPTLMPAVSRKYLLRLSSFRVASRVPTFHLREVK